MQSTTAPIKIPDSGRAQHLHAVADGCSVQGARRDTNEDRKYVSPDMHLGQNSADQAKHDHMRNMLISALGMDDLDFDQEQIRAVDVCDRERFLLASDGLTDSVDEDQLLAIVTENDNPQSAAGRSTQQPMANDAGDDMTCAVFIVPCDVIRPPTASPSPTIWHRLTSLFKPR